VAIPFSIFDAVLWDETLLELRQPIVNVTNMLRCADDLLATVGTMTESEPVVFARLLSLFLDPPREATDPGFEFHVLTALNQLVGNMRDDVMLVLVSVPVSMFFMTLLSEPTADLAVHPAEPMVDGLAVPELPEGPPQPPVGVNFLLVKPQTGFSQFRDGVTELIEIKLRFDRTLLNEFFDPEEKHWEDSSGVSQTEANLSKYDWSSIE
jgi:hypothetical protein